MIWRWKREESHVALAPGESGRGRAAQARLVAALPDPALLLDDIGFFTVANRRALEILDFDPTDHPLSASIRSPQILEAVEHVLKGKEPVRVDYELHVPLPRHFEAFISH